jgi:hypothetical protein
MISEEALPFALEAESPVATSELAVESELTTDTQIHRDTEMQREKN